jgi:hypothetical protein
LEEVDALLGQADGLLRAARFEEALGRLDEARRKLTRARGDAATSRRARLEGLAGTANVALGRDAEARQRFDSALRADPGFRLDPSTTSPKVMRAFDAARGESSAARSGAGEPAGATR